VFRQQP